MFLFKLFEVVCQYPFLLPTICEENLNLKLSRRFSPIEGVEIIFLEDGKGYELELITYKNHKNSCKEKESKIKMGFEIENLDVTIDFLKDKNIEIKEGPVMIKGGRFINIEDPDGVMIGLFQFN